MRPALLLLALLAATPLAAQTIVVDPHIDPPKTTGPDAALGMARMRRAPVGSSLL